ncbi:MAG: hypothetical protein LKJ45_04095 [Oscillospiraceae bacterium]|nr:hypothetical protein [Oscillospiraceae bacterium]
MERFRKQMLRNGVAYLFMAALILLAGLFASNPWNWPYPFPAQENSDVAYGTVIGVVIFLVWYAVSALRAVRNPEILKEKYRKRQDERQVSIERDAFSSACKILLFLLVPADIVASAYSKTVYYALCWVMFLALIVYFLCRVYYMHKY